ncbi:MAG: hypothetical protein ABI954_05015 [Pyrinomonadaceae bacterium]
MKFLLRLLFSVALILAAFFSVTTRALAQVESVVGQFTSTSAAVFVRGVSGDGRFVVLESNGDLATQGRQDQFEITGQLLQPGRNNTDGNFEIFLFDYGQRRIFQITNTKSSLKNVTGSTVTSDNTQVNVVNTNPVISNDGRYLAFASNAYSTVAGNTNPAFFNGNLCVPTATVTDCNVGTDGTNAIRPTLTALQADGNLEIFLYQIPSVTAVDLSSGVDLPLTDLAAGTFTQATNSPQTLPPLPGTAAQAPIVRPDNTLPAINDDGSVVAFVSNRDLVAANSISTNDNNGNDDINREIFVYLKDAATNKTRQITKTAPGDIINQVYNFNPSISGDGRRVAFASTAVNPVRGADGGTNGDVNLEVFYANLDAAGEPNGTATERQVQLTKTARSTPEDTVNIFSYGKRISRDGRFIAFESLSNNPGDATGTVQTGYALFVYDAAPTPSTPPAPATSNYRQYGVRSFEDTAVSGGDFRRYPTFTDYINGAATSLTFSSRINYRADGTIPATATDGLNPIANRPVQVYATPLDNAPGNATTATVSLSRLTRIPTLTFSDVQPFTSNTRQRITFNLASELGGENNDGGFEGFYLISPTALTTTNAGGLSFASGASARPVGSPAPIPSPSPTPTPSGSPVPTPTPITPSAVPALSRGAVAIIRLNYTRPRNAIVASGASTTGRRFELPIELAGVTVNLEGAAAGIYSIDYQRREIKVVLPKALGTGTFRVTVNDNGRISRNTLNIVAAQPDVFNKDPIPGPGGRAQIVNSTNEPILLAEPFFIRTIRRRPYGNAPTRLRLFLTGVRGLNASDFNIRIRDQTITGAQILTGAVETEQPGVYSIDFLLPAALNGAGDVPIIVTTTGGAASRLDDTAPRLQIL